MSHREQSRRTDGGEYFAVLAASEYQALAESCGPNAITTAGALRLIADEGGFCGAVTLDRLGRLTGCGRHAQATALDALEAVGFIRRDAIGGRAAEITLAQTGAQAIAAQPAKKSDGEARKSNREGTKSDRKVTKSDRKVTKSDTRLRKAKGNESDTAAPLSAPEGGSERGATDTNGGGEEWLLLHGREALRDAA